MVASIAAFHSVCSILGRVTIQINSRATVSSVGEWSTSTHQISIDELGSLLRPHPRPRLTNYELCDRRQGGLTGVLPGPAGHFRGRSCWRVQAVRITNKVASVNRRSVRGWVILSLVFAFRDDISSSPWSVGIKRFAT